MLFGNKSPSGIEYLVVGLGNPGEQYALTRHNVGYMAIDQMSKQLQCKPDRLKFKSICGDTIIAGKRVLFLKPTTYMNLSGEAVRAAMDFYKIPMDHVIVIYDDISLEPGKLRIRAKGSHGGHNGIKSIIMLTGLDNFPRIKIGVGNKPHPDYDLAKWVLGRFTEKESEAVSTALSHVLPIVELMVTEQLPQAMNKYN